ncbi:BLOC-2 complex member HPS5 homolog [Uranotaenia lowii]|uniref:BLOC-2 complex member HPS5 homolog n=1 Tax=Uranotaenia lowii TaxID=190385 RepID=UPI00247A06D4|nr:BLOC-2 complex member HPS5 homolog [Uranotaenia lowii]
MIMDALKHYGLGQRTDLSRAINLPLRNTKRIKFTCFDVSEKFLVFGANSGSLYIYDRATVNFLSIIPSQLGPISQLLISRNGKQIAVSNLRGKIGVVLDLDSSATKEILLTELSPPGSNGGSGETDGSSSSDYLPPVAAFASVFVTCFCWGNDDRELYCGDSRGTVSLLQLSLFMGRNILNITLNPVLLLENQIVQIDRYNDMLLVSTLSKCVLCNTAREEFKQIGNRPRDGPYGATFIVANNIDSPTVSDLLDQTNANHSAEQQQSSSPKTMPTHQQTDVRIFCARPGSRLWEADMEGNVLRTHQFKLQQVFGFNRLHTLRQRLLLVHNDRELLLIDPIVSKVVLRIEDLEQVDRVAVLGDEVYVFAAEQKLLHLKIDVCWDERFKPETKKVDGKKNSPFRENGVYILDQLFNSSNGVTKESNIQSEVTIKEALVSVVRGKYGKNIRQMFLGYEQIAPERPKTLNVSKVYNHEENYSNETRVLPTDEAYLAEEHEEVEEPEPVSTRRNPPKKMFSMSLLSDYQLDEDDKTVRNLYLVYRSSIISNLNFSDRYAKIFDTYDTHAIVGLLHKLEGVMEENNEEDPRIKCVKIYFDYLKVELIWEIDDDSRAYIKESFIEYNRRLLQSELEQLEQCESCGHYLRPNANCHYADIGTTLMQYYWSRKEYPQCFELVQQIPYLWHSITRYYVQDQREDKMIQCLWSMGDCGLLEKTAEEIFTATHWRQLFDVMLTCYNSNSLMCLNCDKLCTLNESGRDLMWPRKDNNCTGSSTKTSDNSKTFYSWNYILNVAISSGTIGGKALLKLVQGYDEYIPTGAIGSGFYCKCLLNATTD